MKNKKLVWIITIWVTVKILNYYFDTFLFLPLVLFLAFFFFLIMFIIQTTKTIKERKHLTQLRIQKLTVYGILLIINCLYPYTNTLIEKADWHLSYNKRIAIIEQVHNFELRPRTDNNYFPKCKLPYKLPVVSNNGNEIIIKRKSSHDPKITVEFIIYQGFIDEPSTMLIYSDDPVKLQELQKRIKVQPDENWKLEENWYRIRGEF
jgi:hypothetical protein